MYAHITILRFSDPSQLLVRCMKSSVCQRTFIIVYPTLQVTCKVMQQSVHTSTCLLNRTEMYESSKLEVNILAQRGHELWQTCFAIAIYRTIGSGHPVATSTVYVKHVNWRVSNVTASS